MKRLAMVICLCSLSACDLYQEDDPCPIYYGDEAPPQEYVEFFLRDPLTGLCQYFGQPGPGPYPCDDRCGPCPLPAGDGALQAPLPTWGTCEGSCESLDEATCLDAYGCRAAYVDSCPFGGDCEVEAGAFIGCWAVDQTGPIEVTQCAGLGAQECSTSQDCIAIHADSCSGQNTDINTPCYGQFEACAPEPQRCSASVPECGPGQVCDLTACELPAGDRLVECQGVCVPEHDPVGICYGEVVCDSLPPECPAGSLPGIVEGCYSGYCIPEANCEVPPLACAQIEAEATCIARADCGPLYQGVDCSCDGDVCDCAQWNFVACAVLAD